MTLDRSMFATADHPPVPAQTTVVVIGGGVVGVTAALSLARWGIPVALFEKGRIAGEQSSRNWGWIRKQGRDPRELPLMIESQRLWQEMALSLGTDIGLRQGGTTYLAHTNEELAAHGRWLEDTREFGLDSRLLTSDEVDDLLGQTRRRFCGALHTPSDLYAEPALAVPALAELATRAGATLFETCAVRTLECAGGRITAVVTEHGRVACEQVILAGGVWSRPLLENTGFDLPQLAIKSSAQRTDAAPLISASAIGGGSASIRRRLDGGYTVARSGAARFDIIPAAFKHFRAFLPIVRERWRILSLRCGPSFFGALGRRRWEADQLSPFELTRTFDPPPDHRLLDAVLVSARDLFPQLSHAKPVERWAAMIDVTPDEVPVIGPIDTLSGLTLATGLSGHGFGLGPGVGHLAAQLAVAHDPVVDPAPFRYHRFAGPPRASGLLEPLDTAEHGRRRTG